MQIYNHLFEDQYSEKGVLESSVLRIQNLQIALERAVQDISLLQKNLAYVIQVKEQLQQEVKVRQKREETILKQFQRQLAKKQNQIQILKSDREQIAQLLSDTKDNLNSREAAIMQREEERRRFQRIIQDQRSTIQVLQEQLLAAKYNSDLSYQSISFDNIKIQEMEKQNDTLRLQLGKVKSILQKQTQRCRKSEKQLQGFKNWLGSVMGVRKVVQGCEQILMQQIQNRLNNYSKY